MYGDATWTDCDKGGCLMPVPEIPEQRFRPSVKDSYVDLVESIALEKMALANLIEAEAKKIQTFTLHTEQQDHNSNRELLKMHEYTLKIMDTIGMQQRLLLQKLQLIKEWPWQQLEEDRQKFLEEMVEGEADEPVLETKNKELQESDSDSVNPAYDELAHLEPDHPEQALSEEELDWRSLEASLDLDVDGYEDGDE